MPPIGESNYPRPSLSATYGTADKLQALGDGYFGLNRAFLLNLLVLIAVAVLIQAIHNPFATVGLLLILFVSSGVLSFFPNRKIAFAKDWGIGNAVLGSLLVAFTCWFCLGAIGYVVMQTLATKEMKRYGIQVRSFGGVKKKALTAAVAERRALEASIPRAAVAAPGFAASE